MGIKGLLKLLQPITQQIHLSKLQGKKAAIDMMSLLYKGAFSVCDQLIPNFQAPTDRCLKFIGYPIRVLKMIQNLNIQIIAVFDGRFLNLKKEVMERRFDHRQNYIEKAKEYLQNNNRHQALRNLQRGFRVNRWMVDYAVDAMRQLGFEYVVAPYEADAQIAYLVQHGFADFAISEDSDLLVFGCPVLATKLKPNGECFLIDMNMIKKTYDTRHKGKKSMIQETKGEDEFPIDMSKLDKVLSQIISLDQNQFLQMCILSGCDYLGSIPGMGLKTAVKKIYQRKSAKRVIQDLSSNKGWREKIPKDYSKQFELIKVSFEHQKVFKWPKCQQLVSVKTGQPLPDDLFNQYGQEIINKYTGDGIQNDDCKPFAKGFLYISNQGLREKTTDQIFERAEIEKGLNLCSYNFDLCVYKSDPAQVNRKRNFIQKTKKTEQEQNIAKMTNEINKVMNDFNQVDDEQDENEDVWIGYRQHKEELQEQLKQNRNPRFNSGFNLYHEELNNNNNNSNSQNVKNHSISSSMDNALLSSQYLNMIASQNQQIEPLINNNQSKDEDYEEQKMFAENPENKTDVLQHLIQNKQKKFENNIPDDESNQFHELQQYLQYHPVYHGPENV